MHTELTYIDIHRYICITIWGTRAANAVSFRLFGIWAIKYLCDFKPFLIHRFGIINATEGMTYENSDRHSR